MACGPLEANKVEQFHIAGPCVNAEQIRRRPHFYVRHRNVVDSGIDCASTTSEPIDDGQILYRILKFVSTCSLSFMTLLGIFS